MYTKNIHKGGICPENAAFLPLNGKELIYKWLITTYTMPLPLKAAEKL